MMGGDITVTSEPRMGSAFTIRLPGMRATLGGQPKAENQDRRAEAAPRHRAHCAGDRRRTQHLRERLVAGALIGAS